MLNSPAFHAMHDAETGQQERSEFHECGGKGVEMPVLRAAERARPQRLHGGKRRNTQDKECEQKQQEQAERIARHLHERQENAAHSGRTGSGNVAQRPASMPPSSRPRLAASPSVSE